jgi:hypothetical protein
MGWAFSAILQKRNAYRVLVDEPDRKTLLELRSSRREYNSNLDLRRIGRGLWTGSMCLGIGTYSVFL